MAPRKGGNASIEYSQGRSGELDWTQLTMRRLPACARDEGLAGSVQRVMGL